MAMHYPDKKEMHCRLVELVGEPDGYSSVAEFSIDGDSFYPYFYLKNYQTATPDQLSLTEFLVPNLSDGKPPHFWIGTKKARIVSGLETLHGEVCVCVAGSLSRFVPSERVGLVWKRTIRSFILPPDGSDRIIDSWIGDGQRAMSGARSGEKLDYQIPAYFWWKLYQHLLTPIQVDFSHIRG